VTLHEQVRYRGTLQCQKLQSVTQLDTMVKSTMTETCSAVLGSRRNCSNDGTERTDDVFVLTDDRDKWSKYVHGVANPRIEDG